MSISSALLIYYDGMKISQSKLVSHLLELEKQLGDLSTAKVPSRLFKLPIIFESHRQTAAIKRYMETQRPYASYLPDTLDFVAKNNGLERKDLEWILLNSKLMAVSVGFFAALPLCLPIDPRHRLNCPKMNPSRVFTPEGQVSWGGSCMALYNVESPGGYQLTGLTIPGVDILGSKHGYSLDRPWLFEDFDQLTFYEVSEDEYERQLAIFHSGRYEYECEDTTFDMAAHNELLRETKDEVKAMKEKQAKAQADMDRLEKELMEKWTREKAENKIPMDTVEALLNGPNPFSHSLPLRHVPSPPSTKTSRPFALLTTITETNRPGNLENRIPPQRQRVESDRGRRRQARGQRHRRHPRGHEVGDCGAGGGRRGWWRGRGREVAGSAGGCR